MNKQDQRRVSVTDIIEKEDLEVLTPEINTDGIFVSTWQISRPALPLTGWYKDFNPHLIQVLGNVETNYLQNFDNATVRAKYEDLTSHPIPCIIYSKNLLPGTGMIAACHRKQIPLLISHRDTSDLIAELTRWLKVELAPQVSVHGVLVDVYGEGVLIMGDSGIGKSEVALELIRRGHRLVADDAVVIKKVSEATLVGSAPELTRHFLELRGIGVLDIMTMFGVESVKDTQTIDLVINLKDWDETDSYDRLGLDEEHVAFLGNRVVSHTIPVRPGRNLAMIVEGAAVNNRAKKMGYNAAQDLCDRLDAQMGIGSEEESEEPRADGEHATRNEKEEEQ